VSVRCVIVDDEPLSRQRISDLLGEQAEFEVVGEAEDGAEAISVIERLRPDVVFLDIQMPGASGFEVVEALQPPIPLVIFVTAFDSYAVRAFEADAVDYVLKPVDALRFRATAARIRAALAHGGGGWQVRMAAFLERLDAREHQMRRIVIREGDRIFFIDVRDVEWFEAAGNYIRVHTVSGPHLIRMTMQTLEGRLDPKHFARVQRSAIVNLGRVSQLEAAVRGEYDIILKSGERLHLQKAYKDRLRTALGDF
jgi:two-component system LytT family response regulator